MVLGSPAVAAAGSGAEGWRHPARRLGRWETGFRLDLVLSLQAERGGTVYPDL